MTGYSLREDTHSCRLVSKLPDLSDVYANLHLLRKTESNLHIISIKKSTNIPQGHVCAFLVGMQHSPKVKQDLVCGAYIEDWNLTKKKKDVRPIKDKHLFGRNDRIRTCDIVLPKHARYQLRYIPKYNSGHYYNK